MNAVCAVVLAAGLGTRFGDTPKLIAPLAGRPILQHVLDTLAEAGVAPTVVVLGHAADEVRRAVAWRDEVPVVNRHPERGILRSVLLGLRRLDQTWSLPDRTLIVLGDQPRLTAEQIGVLLAIPVDEERPFVVPAYADGRSGNPVLLEAAGRFLVSEYVKRVRAADRGLSQYFALHPEHVRQLDMPGTNPDVDTPTDLDALERVAIVSAGYDALGDSYMEWSARVVDPARQPFIDELISRLPGVAHVLDIGCGPGIPSTRQLAERFEVTGIDISRTQLELARRNVPTARFIEADVATLRFPSASFDAVTAFYSLIHVPRDELPGLLSRIGRWLRPGGLLLAALAAADSPDWTGDWLGQPMFFSGHDTATNRRLLTEAGFEVLRDDEVEVVEPEGPTHFWWVLALRSPA